MTQASNASSTPIRVLICEDQGIAVLQYRKILQSHGYEVVAEVSTAQAAIEVALSVPLDLILMDIRLLGPTDGIEASRQILAHHFVPIVIITASTEEEQVKVALEAGVCGFIAKPVTSQQLWHALQTMLTCSPCQERIDAAQACLKTATTNNENTKPGRD